MINRLKISPFAFLAVLTMLNAQMAVSPTEENTKEEINFVYLGIISEKSFPKEEVLMFNEIFVNELTNIYDFISPSQSKIQNTISSRMKTTPEECSNPLKAKEIGVLLAVRYVLYGKAAIKNNHLSITQNTGSFVRTSSGKAAIKNNHLSITVEIFDSVSNKIISIQRGEYETAEETISQATYLARGMSKIMREKNVRNLVSTVSIGDKITMLNEAIGIGETDRALYLVKQLDFSSCKADLSHPLLHAINADNKEVVKAILENGVDASIVFTIPSALPIAENDKISALMLSLQDKTNSFNILLKEANINYRANDGLSAFDKALINHQVAIAKILLEEGASISAWTPIENNLSVGGVRKWKHKNIVTPVAISPELDKIITSKYGETEKIEEVATSAFWDALKSANKERILSLINPSHINSPNENGISPLMYSIINNISPDIIEALVKNGANVNETHEGESLLIKAVKLQQYNTVKILVENGADKSAFDRRFKTAKDYATSDADMLEALGY